MSDAMYEAAHVENDDLEIRELKLKGKSEPIEVRVMKIR